MNNQEHKGQLGFTLVELMVVVVILGLLGGIGAVAFKEYGNDAKDKIAAVRCGELDKAIDAFTLQWDGDHGEVFDAMIDDKKLKSRKDIEDPWGEEFIVRRHEDGNYFVVSKGPDKSEDTDDDIDKNGRMNDNEGL